jgi:KaiC/GvpD/RAD55 family RecA-like ATPase
MSKHNLGIRNLYNDPYKRITEGDVKFIPIGIPTAEGYMNDLPTKKVTLLTGVPKEGKSTVLHRVALNAVDKGYRVLLIDGEHDQDTLINKLYTMVIGNNAKYYDKVLMNKHHIIEPKPFVLDMLKEWHKDRLTVFSKYLSPFDDLEELHDFVEAYVDANDIDLVIFDNLMMLVNGTNAEKLENQSRFMKRTCDLAKSSNCHCIVVAHPNKSAQQGEEMGIYDVLGNSEIINLVDYMVQIMRSYDSEDEADGYFRLMLNRTIGENVGNIPLYFDKGIRCYFEMTRLGKALKYEFNWKGEGEQNWLKTNPY